MQVITDQKLYDRIWDKIFQEYSFSTQNEKWLCPDTEYAVYRFGSLWDERQEAIVNQILCRIAGAEMYALDWQHDCFLFNPNENIPFAYQYYDTARDCTVYFPTYYPNGDYHFFISKDWSTGLFGHPWRSELIVTGAALMQAIADAADDLNLEKLETAQ
ncbi:MAG: DUF2716 domain-containing protein [Oscillospiraceae bacterium]|nr:DUF2716 domain-containing protein [Oscillospiraceae bacterium]